MFVAMDSLGISAPLRSILRDDLQVDISRITADSHLIDDLGLDSVAFAVGMVAIEERLGVLWRDWYMFFPWEDWREGAPSMIASQVIPSLRQFTDAAANPEIRALRQDRIRLCFGGGGSGWDEEKVLERYELLYEAGLVVEVGPLVEVAEILDPPHHFVILDYACRRVGGDLVAGDDAAEADLVPVSDLAARGVTRLVEQVVARTIALPAW